MPFWRQTLFVSPKPPSGGERFRSWLLIALIVPASMLTKPVPASAQQSAAPASAPADAKSAPAARPDQVQKKHKVGPFEISGSWRARVEGWDWFEANSGDSQYAFMHSLVRLELGRQGDRLDWKLEGAQDAILVLPDQAVVP